MLASVLLVVVIATVGYGLTLAMPIRLRFEERVAIGMVTGPLAVSVLSLVAFLVIGMSWLTLTIGVAAPGLATGFLVARHAEVIRRDMSFAWLRVRLPVRDGRSLRPLLVVTVISAAVSTRILSLSYQTTPEGISVGSLASWSDGAAHAAYAGSFAYGDNRGLDLPVGAGHGFTYHFLADFFGALFTVVGASLPQALVVSAWMFAVAWPVLVWCFVERIIRSRLVAALTMLLFTLSGGVGLWYFAADVDRDGLGVIRSLPRTYARIPDEHLWVDNLISASLFAQRSTQLGLTAGFAAGILLLASRPGRVRAGFAGAGLMVGVLGIGHAHVLLTALAIATMVMLADRDRVWLWFLLPAGAVGLPLAAAILPDTNAMRWMVGWMAIDADQLWPWFWFRNVGLVLPIFLAVAVLGGVPRRVRKLTLPLWLWFIVPNLIAFHPSEWNNTKYFVFWQFAGSLVVATWLGRAWSRWSSRSVVTGPTDAMARWRGPVARVAATSAALLMVSAGGLDTVRAMQRSTAIPWVTNDDLAVSAWIRENTPTDAVLVYAMDTTSAAFSLSGRHAVSGYPGWTWDLGVADWYPRQLATEAILRGDPTATELVRTYHVDLVVIGPDERNLLAASDAYWRQRDPDAFCSGDTCVYRVGEPIGELDQRES